LFFLLLLLIFVVVVVVVVVVAVVVVVDCRRQCLLALQYAKQAIALHQSVLGTSAPLDEEKTKLYAEIYAQVGRFSYKGL
jgi:hypothetical protein